MRYLLFILLLVLSNSVNSQTRHLTIEGNHSSLGFSVDIAGGITKVTGKFLEHDLKLTYVDSDWTKSQIAFTINASSVDTGIKDRDEHLRSSDFFDVENHPTIDFNSKSITSLGENTYVVTGDFSMHGITKEIEIPFTVTSDKENTIGIKIEHQINRVDYDVAKDFKHTSIENFISEVIDVNFYFWTKKDKRFTED